GDRLRLSVECGLAWAGLAANVGDVGDRLGDFPALAAADGDGLAAVEGGAMKRTRGVLVADAGVSNVALEAGVRRQRAVDDLALRVDLRLGVIGVLGKALLEKRSHASILGAAEQGPERPGGLELFGDVGQGVGHRGLDRFDRAPDA